MTGRSRSATWAVASLLMLASCTASGAPSAGSPTSTPSPTPGASVPASSATVASPSPVPFPSLPAVPAGVASDQPCMARLGDPSSVADVGIAADELEALLLDMAALGLDDPTWIRDPWLSSYLDNIEVVTFDPPTEDACAVLERLGRVTGYATNHLRETEDGVGGDRIGQSVEVFLAEDGAAAYIRWRVAALARNEASLTTEPIAGLVDGVLASAADPSGDRTWAFFRSGPLVATLSFSGQTGHQPPVAFLSLVRALADRIAAAQPDGEPYDIAHLMSATLPGGSLPAVFGSLVWDPTFSGCWNAQERIDQNRDPEGEAKDLETFGYEAGCWSMYVPPSACEAGGPCASASPSGSPAAGSPPPSPPTGIVRVATSITVLGSSSLASGYLADSLAETEAAAAKDQPVERFDVPSIAGAVGTRRYIPDAEYTDTSVWLVRGDVLGRAFIHDQTEADHRGDVIAMAKALDARLQEVLETPGG